jgi:tetratricopeptide (TPR) repeat protein
MKNLSLTLLLLFSCVKVTFSQKMPPSIPDYRLLSTRDSAEIAEFSRKMLFKTKSRIYVNDANKNAREARLDSIRNASLLEAFNKIKNSINSTPPSRNALIDELNESKAILQKGIPTPRMAEINKFVAKENIDEIHETAIGSFYNNNPKEGIYLMLNAAVKAPDSLRLINNLGAMLNMVGVEKKAIPLLKYCEKQLPKSSTVMNNLGQSYMGLGDNITAAEYFNKSLSIDSLNVEANHSMGILHSMKKEFDIAQKYFEREFRVAIRGKSLAKAFKTGRKRYDIRKIVAERNKRNKRPQKDYFEEITLGKFSFPKFPTSAKEVISRMDEFNTYGASVQAESMFWMGKAMEISKNYKPEDGDRLAGPYSRLADAMFEELNEEFTPEYLDNFSEKDSQTILDILDSNLKELVKVSCPKAPAGSSLSIQKEYEIKCCEENKRPIADKLLADVGNVMTPIINVGQARWKAYINQMVEIAQLDPSPSNQMTVYGSVSAYFNYLSWATLYLHMGNTENHLNSCTDNYDPHKLDSLLAAERRWNLSCPPAFNMEVNIGPIALKTDCNKYALEGGEGIVAGFEHEFKSGKSTLLLGPGAKLEFLNIVKFEAKHQYYVSFDKNKEFADFGIKNTFEAGIGGVVPIKGIKIGGVLAGVELSNTMGLNSGYEESFEKKGVIAEIFK